MNICKASLNQQKNYTIYSLVSRRRTVKFLDGVGEPGVEQIVVVDALQLIAFLLLLVILGGQSGPLSSQRNQQDNSRPLR